ncbi:hypothetical protein SprV_1002814400 [Sparganum proliferum]
MGLFGHMRIHENGIDRSTDSSTTPNPAPSSPPCAPTALPATDTDTTDFACPHCPRTFSSRIGLVGHLRIHRTETGVPVPGAPIYTHQARLNCPHCPRTFRHRMGLFGHMRIHESGIDRSPETPTTSNTSTAPSPTLHPSPDARLTTTTTTESAADDTDTATSHVHTVHAHSPHSSAWSVTCESIAQRLANQCLEHQPIPIRLVSTVHTAPALSDIAWACSATCASTMTCGRQPPASSHHHTPPPSLIHRHPTIITTHPSQAPTRHLPCKWEVRISTRSPCGSGCTGDLSPRLSRHSGVVDRKVAD